MDGSYMQRRVKFFVLALFFFWAGFSTAQILADRAETASLPEKDMVTVYIGGAVQVPGMYTLKNGTVLEELLIKACPAEDAFLDSSASLRHILLDGEKIIIPAAETDSGEEKRININSCTADDLVALKGIGEQKAAAIIDYRKENGLFASVDDLKEVKGIGDCILEDNRDMLTLH